MKFILKIPITATPAADPITNKLPPVPAQYAKNSQKTPSTAKSPVALISYIPIAPATKGTLSKIADKNPMNIFIIYKLPLNTSSRILANEFKIPVDCKLPTANNIPKKKNIVDASIFDSAPTTVSECFCFLSLFLWIISVTVHSTPKLNSIPKYGGKCVTVLNTGTNSKPKTPNINKRFLS